MIVPIQSVMIMAVERSTSFRDIVRVFSKYATISHISVDGFETNGGGKYNRVYVTIDSWHDTEDAYAFIKLVRTGRARLNYWWDIRDNTHVEQVVEQEKVQVEKKLEQVVVSEKERFDRLEKERFDRLEKERFDRLEKEMFDRLEKEICALLFMENEKAHQDDDDCDCDCDSLIAQTDRHNYDDYSYDYDYDYITEDNDWRELSNAIAFERFTDPFDQVTSIDV
jgi:hypothetical protein